MPGRITSILLL
ncbi:hypothetical protein NGA_0418320 [Nannochloropsis gaditana CCMP526]|nr:hypothetical protein NGA_0418320 [Nannochloropsis gaditana CCMP526]EKU23322.1 hypothetical protein NGA_0418320 [Nannochloropsis gaditana CCMP526]|eukprot:XP_005852510.1 hypothetical protein NGA_0418320 [Nannochloropsis gaditana CCMP526]